MINFLSKLYMIFGAKLTSFVFLVVLCTIVESIGIGIFYPIIDLMMKSEVDNAQPVYFLTNVQNTIKYIFQYFDIELNNVNISLFLLIIFLLKSFLVLMTFILQANMRANLLSYLKSEIYKSFVSLNLEKFKKLDAGELINTTNEQTNRSMLCFIYFSVVIINFSNFIFFIALALIVQFNIAATVCGLIFFLYIPLRVLNKKVKILSEDIRKRNTYTTSHIRYGMSGFKYLKATGQGGKFSTRCHNLLSNIVNLEKKIGYLTAFIRSGKDLFIIVGIMPLLYVIHSGNVDLGLVLTSIALTFKAFQAAFQLQLSYQSFLEFQPSIVSSFNMIGELNKHQDNIHTQQEFSKPIKNVELRNISYKYRDRKLNVLTNFSYTLEKGEIYIIHGASGSGKSTLVDLTIGLLNPSEGKVIVNGQFDMSYINYDFRKNVAYLPQEPFLIGGSFVDNILLFSNSKLKNSDINRLMKLIHSFGLKDLFPTKESLFSSLEDDATTLSGGQKQRLAIIRELFLRKEVIILDEPTSALDSLNANKVIKVLEKISENAIIIISTHDPKIITKFENTIKLL